nr:MAG TPA: hypothetical protein [Bacteriophage sp.]
MYKRASIFFPLISVKIGFFVVSTISLLSYAVFCCSAKSCLLYSLFAILDCKINIWFTFRVLNL